MKGVMFVWNTYAQYNNNRNNKKENKKSVKSSVFESWTSSDFQLVKDDEQTRWVSDRTKKEWNGSWSKEFRICLQFLRKISSLIIYHKNDDFVMNCNLYTLGKLSLERHENVRSNIVEYYWTCRSWKILCTLCPLLIGIRIKCRWH